MKSSWRLEPAYHLTSLLHKFQLFQLLRMRFGVDNLRRFADSMIRETWYVATLAIIKLIWVIMVLELRLWGVKLLSLRLLGLLKLVQLKKIDRVIKLLRLLRFSDFINLWALLIEVLGKGVSQGPTKLKRSCWLRPKTLGLSKALSGLCQDYSGWELLGRLSTMIG